MCKKIIEVCENIIREFYIDIGKNINDNEIQIIIQQYIHQLTDENIDIYNLQKLSYEEISGTLKKHTSIYNDFDSDRYIDEQRTIKILDIMRNNKIEYNRENLKKLIDCISEEEWDIFDKPIINSKLIDTILLRFFNNHDI